MSERLHMHSDTSRYAPSPESGTAVNAEQSVKPKEFPKGTFPVMSVAEIEQGEKDLKFKEQTKGVIKDFEAKEDEEKKAVIRQAQIKKSRTPEAKKRHEASMAKLEQRTKQAEEKRFRHELLTGKRKTRYSSPESIRTALAEAGESIEKEQKKRLAISAEREQRRAEEKRKMSEITTEDQEMIDSARLHPEPTKETIEELAYIKNMGPSTRPSKDTLEVLAHIKNMRGEEFDKMDLPGRKVKASDYGRKAAVGEIINSDKFDNEAEEYDEMTVTSSVGKDIAAKRARKSSNGAKTAEVAGEIENLPDSYRPIEKPSNGIEGSAMSTAEKRAAIDYVTEGIEANLVAEATAAYVNAYREYDPQFTQNKLDQQIAVIKPPMLAGFLRSANSAGNILKRLYKEMEEAQAHAQNAEVVKSLAQSEAVTAKTGIQEDLIAAAKESDERERKSVSVKQQRTNNQVDRMLGELDAKSVSPLILVNKFLKREVKSGDTSKYLQAVKERSGMNPNFSSPLTRELKNKSVAEGIKSISEVRVEGIKQRLAAIESYFSDKNRDQNKTIRQFLLGEEIKGWLKGGQRQKQEEYKELYHNPVYQKYLTK